MPNIFEQGAAMVSQITAATFSKLQFNAGAVLKNFSLVGIENAGALADAATGEAAMQNSWLGASDGDVKISENRRFWSPSMNGKRMPFVGEKQVDSADPTMSVTLLEYTPNNVATASAAADMVTAKDGGKTTIQPRITLQPGDYLTNVVFIGNLGADGYAVAELDNALCTSGLDWTAADKNTGKLRVEFHAHSNSPVFSDNLPCRYYLFRPAVEATAE